MVRVTDCARVFVGWVVKGALGLTGLAVVLGVYGDRDHHGGGPGASRPARADVGVIRLNEGEPAGHLTVVDDRGRELMIVTRFRDGNLAFVMRTGPRAQLAAWVGPAGRVRFSTQGDGWKSWLDHDAEHTSCGTVPVDSNSLEVGPPRTAALR